MKRRLPLLLGFLVGGFAVAEFYIPAQGARTIQSFLLEAGQALAAAAIVLGAINVVQVNLPIIQRRREDWGYKVVLILSALIMGLAGVAWHDFGVRPTAGTIAVEGAAADGATATIAVRVTEPDADVQMDGLLVPVVDGVATKAVEPGEHRVTVAVGRSGYTGYEGTVAVAAGQTATVRPRLQMKWGIEGRVYYWLYDHLFAPCNATMFALLAFFIASAAFRAFRARNLEAALLLGAAILVMLGRVPIGRAIWSFFPALSDWIIDVPNNAGRRAIMMGAALGAIATGLRVILGLERSHLGKD